MGLRRWFLHGSRFGRLKQYPELRGFPRGRANVLVRRYEREEKSTRPWRLISAVFWPYMLLLCTWPIWINWLFSEAYAEFAFVAFSLLLVPFVIATLLLHDSMQKRVSLRVVDELGGGRLRVCLKCGYDLRGTPGEVCSECGASVYLAVVRS
jgi:hypothetical protein